MDRRSFLTLAAAAGLAAPAMAQARPLTVFAAASLKEGLDDAANAYAATGQPRPALSYAGSNQLARQIEQGAPADLFLSADEEWMDWLAQRGLIQPQTRKTLLGNSLVLIGPRGSAARAIDKGLDLSSLLQGGHLAMPDPASVPAGKYAKAALEHLGLYGQVKNRIAGTENVRVALALVARGEAPLGIVYATDAKAQPDVAVIGTFAQDTHPPIAYPVALTKDARTREAQDFLAFLQSARAQALFAARGFTILQAAR